tara:strand:- start:929 stop:1609 length:681 start_codon:yes stop_codon:yes gene_type:complete
MSDVKWKPEYEGQWNEISLKNIPVLSTKLSQEVIDHLWKAIEQAKKDALGHNDQLAGNIGSSLILKDTGDVLLQNIDSVLFNYINESLSNSHVNRNFLTNLQGKKQKIRLDWSGLWVNFQKKYEFNPVHEHTGVISFVIWMRIPTSYKVEHALPHVANSNCPSASNFQIQYVNVLGEMNSHDVCLDKESEGIGLFFPSTMRHQVYPFYGSDEDRISISGNLMYRQV